MKRLFIALSFLLSIFYPINAVKSAVILAEGKYASGNSIISNKFDIFGQNIAPGQYKFHLIFTNPVVVNTNAGNSLIYALIDYEYYDIKTGVNWGGNEDEILVYFKNGEKRQKSFTTSNNINIFTPYSTTNDFEGTRTEYLFRCCTWNIGFNAHDNGQYTLSYTAVPEPQTWIMIILGFILIGSQMRSKNYYSTSSRIQGTQY